MRVCGMLAYMYVGVCMHVCLCVCTCVSMCACMCVCVCVRMYSCVRASFYLTTFMHMHSCTHSRTGCGGDKIIF